MKKLDPDPLAEHGIEPGWNYGLQFMPRWSELDGFAHVSHRAHFGWFEEARNGYLAQLGFPIANADVPGPVIKETSCTYERGLALDDPIVVTARTKWFGSTSFMMEYAIWSHGLVARGSAVIVWYQNSSSLKVPLPSAMSQAMVVDGAVKRVPREASSAKSI